MYVIQEIILNIDIAPTLLDLAGVSDGSEEVTDGQSFKSLLITDSPPCSESQWRTEFLVEHSGEFHDIVKGCPDLSHQNVAVCLLSLTYLSDNSSNLLYW